MQLQDTTGMDRAQWYETRRNELLKLLERTTGLEIPKEYAKELADIRKKCLENQFEIVLVAQFQGGKSTTFNTLCDGRDLSPRGLGGGGIKTSAAIISAQNISDGETKNGMDEWAEITFKSKYEIQYGMFDILHETLSEDQNFKNSVIKTGMKEEDYLKRISSSAEFAKILDLDNPIHRKAVRDTLNKLWDQWSADKSLFTDKESKDILDRLRIATLIEHFYNTPEYKELITKTTTGIYDFQSLVAFPTNWEPRWCDGQKASFKLSEVAFIFIARTLLRIKSKNLSRVGCRISDCPGLFANAFDTNVTTNAIMNSDAVWYLIDGEKQIGQQDLKALDYIEDMGMASKIVGSVNFKGNHANIKKNIFPTTEAILKNKGFTFPLLPYDARLAFLSNQGERIAKQELSSNDLHGMIVDSDNTETLPIPTPEDMWVEMINTAQATTKLRSLRNVINVSEESVALVREESHIDGTMDFLNKDIISKKSRAILIDSGSRKAADALQEYEGILKTSEDAALLDEKTWKKNVEESKAELKRFISESKDLIDESPLVIERAQLSEALAKDLVSQIFDDKFIEEIGFTIAYSLVVQHTKFQFTRKEVVQAIFKDASPKIDELFKSGMAKILTLWANNTLTSTNWHTYKTRLSILEKRINRLWNTDISMNHYLKRMSLRIRENIIPGDQLKKIRGAVFSSIKVPDLAQKIVSKLGSFNGILGLITSFFKSQQAISQQNTQKATKIAKNYINNELKQQLSSLDSIAEISKPLIPAFEVMQACIIRRITNSLVDLLVRFEKEHVDPATRNFSESETKRKEIAEKNHKIRVEQIEPLRREIREFEAQVSNEINA